MKTKKWLLFLLISSLIICFSFCSDKLSDIETNNKEIIENVDPAIITRATGKATLLTPKRFFSQTTRTTLTDGRILYPLSNGKSSFMYMGFKDEVDLNTGVKLTNPGAKYYLIVRDISIYHVDYGVGNTSFIKFANDFRNSYTGDSWGTVSSGPVATSGNLVCYEIYTPLPTIIAPYAYIKGEFLASSESYTGTSVGGVAYVVYFDGGVTVGSTAFWDAIKAL
ncbi:MAG: hypothetical protein LUG98_08215 [Tannerellaceae bacterium]|nr:hypothetical protein [Tannerellaceae bacterium]